MSETEAKWVERLREWRDSGKTAEEFAAGKPYKASTLKWWRTQLQKRGEVEGQTRERTQRAANLCLCRTRKLPLPNAAPASPSRPD